MGLQVEMEVYLDGDDPSQRAEVGPNLRGPQANPGVPTVTFSGWRPLQTMRLQAVCTALSAPPSTRLSTYSPASNSLDVRSHCKLPVRTCARLQHYSEQIRFDRSHTSASRAFLHCSATALAGLEAYRHTLSRYFVSKLRYQLMS